MQHDIWRYITNGKGTASRHTGFWLYSIPDLSRLPLPEHWWYFLNKSHEEGYAVQPPMKIKPVLSWTFPHKIRKDNKIMAAPRLPVERLRIDIFEASSTLDCCIRSFCFARFWLSSQYQYSAFLFLYSLGVRWSPLSISTIFITRKTSAAGSHLFDLLKWILRQSSLFFSIPVSETIVAKCGSGSQPCHDRHHPWTTVNYGCWYWQSYMLTVLPFGSQR